MPVSCAKGEVLVLDASALASGIPNPSSSTLATTRPVEEEARRLGRWELEALEEAGSLLVLEPPGAYLAEASEAARKVGDLPSLSEADLGLLALALRLRAEGYCVHLVTNDVAIQNVAMALGLEVAGTFAGRRRRIDWIYYCPACGFSAAEPPPGMVCPRCGSRIRRKARRKIHK